MGNGAQSIEVFRLGSLVLNERHLNGHTAGANHIAV
jgi:hypothetical protein